MAASWTTEETEALVSIWGRANVQNELDAVARVISSTREVPSTSRLSLHFQGERGSYVRNSRHAIHSRRKATSGAEDQPLGCSVLDTRSLRARHMHGLT